MFLYHNPDVYCKSIYLTGHWVKLVEAWTINICYFPYGKLSADDLGLYKVQNQWVLELWFDYNDTYNTLVPEWGMDMIVIDLVTVGLQPHQEKL